MLNSSGIINCDITSSDLLRAEEIYGPSVASLKGKTVKNFALPNKDEGPVRGLQEADYQTMNVDIMYVIRGEAQVEDYPVNFCCANWSDH